MLLIGLTIRTSYDTELNENTSKIGPLLAQYYSQQIASQVPERKKPGVSIAVYLDYQSNEYDEYTYFIGEEVSSINDIPEGLTAIIIPEGRYQCLTTEAGKIPDIIIESWKQIWEFTEIQLGGKRRYTVDFEVYDQRAADLENAIVDIYIGLE